MYCFSCISPRNERKRMAQSATASPPKSLASFIDNMEQSECKGMPTSPTTYIGNNAQQFNIRELELATENFRSSNLIGEGGFGRVFKGKINSGKIVAIKQLNQDGNQGSKEFLVECLMLIMLNHPNLVNLIGYCAQGDERLLIYEFMSKGSLEMHLFDVHSKKPHLDWNTRMKIALGSAKGLTYLHEVADPPVIYRDLKSANILLDEDFNPKLSDFGLAKLAPVGDVTHVSTRVMGTYGYCAPEYAMSGRLTVKADIYSFGVVLLELITGRQAFDITRPMGKQSLIAWSSPFLNDRKQFHQLVDPRLQGRYPTRPLYQVVAVTASCLKEDPLGRPTTRDILNAIQHVALQPYDCNTVERRN